MDLSQALRFTPPDSLPNPALTFHAPVSAASGIAFVGAGGKSTAIFSLAHRLSGDAHLPVIITATSHLHIDQAKLADSHWLGSSPDSFSTLEEHLHGVILVTGPVEVDRTTALDPASLDWLHELCGYHDIPLLIEADGSRRHPLKAPAEHEPPIPSWAGMVVVVAGLSALGKPLSSEIVHRPGIFAPLSGLAPGEIITPQALERLLLNPLGGLKNIPEKARRVVLINQAATPGLQSQAHSLAEKLLPTYAAVIIADLAPENPAIHAVHEPVAGIILAAGESSRFGSPKQVQEYQGEPFVRRVARTALSAGLSPVVVVTGAEAEQVERALAGLPVRVVRNETWKEGQGISIRTGVQSLPHPTGAVLFLLADQPQVSPAVIRALVEKHAASLAPVVAPLVQEQRANPVLFDRLTFPALLALTGDVGGRAVFSKFPPAYLPWNDVSLLVDVDTPADLERLSGEGA